MPTPLVLPVAEFAPDLPAGAGSTHTIWNAYPRTPVSYGPVNSPVPQYNALPARCQGGAAYRDDNGNVYIFAGTQTDLYMLKAGLAGWQIVSKIDGGYAAGIDPWHFVYFNGAIIASNIGVTLQRFRPGTDTDFTDLPGAGPRGKSIAVVKNSFVVLGNTWDATNGYKRQRVWWSGAGDATSWPALGTDLAAQVQSNAVDLLGEGGDVQGIAAGLSGADAAVFQEYAVRRMEYSGPGSVFAFYPVQSGRGLLCPDSLVVNGGIAYYWSQGGIEAFSGSESRALGANRVDKTVYEELNPAYLYRVIGVNDPINRLIWWAYPTGNSIGGNPDRLLMYNWELDRFSLSELTCETILRLLSIGYTLDELYTVLGYTLDTIPAPLDSPIWRGGRLTLGLFGSDHRINFLTGTPLAATVETAELPPPPGRRWLIANSRPIVDGVGTVPSVSIGRRERQQDAVSYTGAVPLNAMGQCPVRASGRYLRAKITIPAGAREWDNISGIELDLTPQGRR